MTLFGIFCDTIILWIKLGEDLHVVPKWSWIRERVDSIWEIEALIQNQYVKSVSEKWVVYREKFKIQLVQLQVDRNVNVILLVNKSNN